MTPLPERAAAAFLLVATAPVLLVAMLAVARTGPVFFWAPRAGPEGAFAMVKLRTMVPDAAGGSITAARDPRVTPAGRWLRPTRLDELPQLWHVVRGEMRLVGPRPEAPAVVAVHPSPLMERWLRLRPGLTSPGTLFAMEHEGTLGADGDADADYAARVLVRRMELDLAYESERSLLSDLAVIGRTGAMLGARILGR